MAIDQNTASNTAQVNDAAYKDCCAVQWDGTAIDLSRNSPILTKDWQPRVPVIKEGTNSSSGEVFNWP